MDVLDVALLVAGALEKAGVAYFLGGSMASSFQGEPRATNDVDFVVDLTPAGVAPLAAALGSDFDVDEEALRRAARERSSWNVIYVPTVTKIDLFIRRDDAFDRSEFARRRLMVVRAGRSLCVKSAEDTVLRKLLWYRSGGGVSDRQWRDLVEVLRHSRAQLDTVYLEDWAGKLGLTGLLVKGGGAHRRLRTLKRPGPGRCSFSCRPRSCGPPTRRCPGGRAEGQRPEPAGAPRRGSWWKRRPARG
jgi:hypothetical protein